MQNANGNFGDRQRSRRGGIVVSPLTFCNHLDDRQECLSSEFRAGSYGVLVTVTLPQVRSVSPTYVPSVAVIPN